jgi:hypothetical protein
LCCKARGTNRDFDVMEALTLAGAEPTGAPLNDLHAGKVAWDAFQLLVIPGGFSYADALGAGRLLALDLTAYFADEIAAFVASGKPVIGICNGFQALVKAGILPGAPVADAPGSEDAPRVPRPSQLAPRYTLTHNASGRFECRWVTLRPASSRCIWTQGLTELVATPGRARRGQLPGGDAGGHRRAAGGGSGRPDLCQRKRRTSPGRISAQSQRLCRRHRRRLQQAGQRAGVDAAPGEPHSSVAAPALDARRTRPQRPAAVSERRAARSGCVTHDG